jgi:3',5'-cyclic AMP phosphodiesterase CpdA
VRTIAHISDLHFGRVDERLLDPLLAGLDAARPDVVAISGDLTQRARDHQFRAAARFLSRLRWPTVVVPGNHDVPLFNVFARFAHPLRGYRRHITADPAPFWVDDELAVLGINTARSLTWKAGRINERQVELARSRMCALPDRVLKIVVTHHPFDVAHASDKDQVVGRAGMAMRALAECGVDVLLSGHLHRARVGDTSRYCIGGHSALVVQAGTTLSERTREETNSFNVLHAEHDRVRVEHHHWDGGKGRFRVAAAEDFRREGDVWRSAR